MLLLDGKPGLRLVLEGFLDDEDILQLGEDGIDEISCLVGIFSADDDFRLRLF